MNDPSFPAAFETRMKQTLSTNWQAFYEAHQLPSPVSVRINPKKCVNTLGGSNIPWTQYGYYLSERPSFTFDPSFHAGSYYVQEASSMFLEQVLIQCADLKKSLNVLDLSAAPGGKSTHIISLLNEESLLVSNEVIRSRATILAENIQKWGYSNVVVSNNDPEAFKTLTGFFDVIVIDAPCSGEGLFRKDPEAMKHWSADNVALCCQRQQRILHTVWPSLKQGGIVIYSTCTYNKEENEENLHRFSQEHAVEFLPIQINKSWGIEEVTYKDTTGYRFYPHKLVGEGFFISAFKKKEQENESKLKNTKSQFSPPSKKIQEQVQDWLIRSADKAFIMRNDLVQSFPAAKKTEIEWLARQLYIITAGIYIATVKHDKLIPEHGLALSVELNKENFNRLSLSLEEALLYLRKETLSLAPAIKGFALITYNELPLGWANVLPNRINNLYPSEWRIRKSG